MVISAGPKRHRPVMPGCDCGLCLPTLANRRGKSRRFTLPVTLVAALAAEDAACRPGMVQEHLACLSSLVSEVNGLIVATPWDDVDRPGVGLAVIMFAAELASALALGECSVLSYRQSWSPPASGR